MKIPSLTKHHRRQAGFSLAEVAIATGITAMAFTTLLGLIPQGLNNIRQAGDLAAETRITAHIVGAVNQAKWQDLAGTDLVGRDFDGKKFLFDDQGIAIEPEQAGELLAYVAEVTAPRQDVMLPSSGPLPQGIDPNDPFLRRVTVRVATAANPEFDFENALPIAYRTHTTLIARTGK